MSWVTVWLLVGRFNAYPPNYPPFKTQSDCEAVVKFYNGTGGWTIGQCIQVTILAK